MAGRAGPGSSRTHTSSAFALGQTLENRTHTGCSVITACVLCFYQGIYLTAHYSLLSHAPATYLTCPSQHVDSFHFHKQKRSVGLPKRVSRSKARISAPPSLIARHHDPAAPQWPNKHTRALLYSRAAIALLLQLRFSATKFNRSVHRSQ